MKPIRDLSEVNSNAVLYHSAFGFAQVADISAQDEVVLLKWSESDKNLPERVSATHLKRVYALCEKNGFFDRMIRTPSDLQEDLHFDSLGTLEAMLKDLATPQRLDDIRDWLVGRLMTHNGFSHWWASISHLLSADPRFATKGDTYYLAQAGPPNSDLLAQFDSPALDAARRLDLALTHRSSLNPESFKAQVFEAWRSGGNPVRDLALTSLRDLSADEILGALLEGIPTVESLVHAIRRGDWKASQVSPSIHQALIEPLEAACYRGGQIDSEARLAAALIRWGSPTALDFLASSLDSSDGQRLVRSTLAAMKTPNAKKLSFMLLNTRISSESPAAGTHWLANEILETAQLGPDELSKQLASSFPQLSQWFNDGFDPFWDSDWEDDDQLGTAELEIDWLNDANTHGEASYTSGANVLSFGASIAKALHHAQVAAGQPVCPTRDTLKIAADGGLSFEGIGDPALSPRPAGEPSSIAADIYAAATLIIEHLTAQRWPSGLSPARAIPYLRLTCESLPVSALAPIDAALRIRSDHRPASAQAWEGHWQACLVAEELRAFSVHNTASKLSVGYDSHIGKRKLLLTQTNQDAIFVANREDIGLLIVCDGISTATAGSGDLASGITTHVIASLWEQAIERLQRAEPEQIKEFLDHAIRMANQSVCEAALRLAGGSIEGKIPMGTTAVIGITRGNRISLAWLGDSRAYLVGPYGTSLLTSDQNQAAERFQDWVGDFDEHWEHNGYALIGYIGHFDEFARPNALPASHLTLTLLPGERLMMCSDGVTDYIGDLHPEVSGVIDAITRNAMPEHAARRLIEQANRGGGGDNISAVVVCLQHDESTVHP